MKLGHMGLHNFSGPGIPGRYVNEGKGDAGVTGGAGAAATTMVAAPSASVGANVTEFVELNFRFCFFSEKENIKVIICNYIINYK